MPKKTGDGAPARRAPSTRKRGAPAPNAQPNGQPNAQPNGRDAAEAPNGSGGPALSFLADWRELQHGDLVAGETFVLRYEPGRLTGARPGGAPIDEVIGHARFVPGGVLRRALLLGRADPTRAAPAEEVAAVDAELRIPAETKQVELWFEGTDRDGETVWDSHFGRNYRFPVVHRAPEPEGLPTARPNAVTDPARVSVANDAAVKENAFPSRPGYPSGRASLQTTLHVAARVRADGADDASAVTAWVDVHAYESDAALVRSATIPLRRAEGGDASEPFVLDTLLYQGLVATPGSVTPKADVRTVRYRLYCDIGGTVYTDGVLHYCELATDAVSG